MSDINAEIDRELAIAKANWGSRNFELSVLREVVVTRSTTRTCCTGCAISTGTARAI